MQKSLSRLKSGLCFLLVFGLFVLIPMTVGYGSDTSSSRCEVPEWKGKNVSIKKTPSHFQVEINYNCGLAPRQMGEEYATGILHLLPAYEQILDSYLAYFIGKEKSTFLFFLERTHGIKNQIPREYREEIEGFASRLSGANRDQVGDGHLSLNELYVVNTLGDVLRVNQCSAVSVFGARSATGHTITGRNFDWIEGGEGQIHRIQAIIIYKNGAQSICSIGYVGLFGVVTAFNRYGVFGATLDSPTGVDYSSSVGKHSYDMDLRYALEHNYNIPGVANDLLDTSKGYTFNHLIFLSDSFQSQVLENNFSGTGSNMHRALRDASSTLNPGIPWGIDNSVAAVNSFMLWGNHDNFTNVPSNTMRWNSMITLLNSAGKRVSREEMKKIMGFHAGDEPEDGDLYRKGSTSQIIIFEPLNHHLEVYFHPKNGEPTGVPNFETIPVCFD